MSTILLNRTREQLRELLRVRGLSQSGFPRDLVQDVVILASSSRGGSSFLAEVLRRSHELLHLRGEINPFLRLSGLVFPHSGTGSDVLNQEHLADIGDLGSFLLWEVGDSVVGFSDYAAERCFALELYERLLLQWPGLDFDCKQVQSWVAASLRTLQSDYAWDPGDFPDPQLFHALFLSKVRSMHPQVNPFFYDLSPELIRTFCPDARLPNGPPGELVLEEPPFILLTPWQQPEDFSRPLIIKTPSNVYRMGFFRALFPHARFRVLYLTRNPAASINGLYDGWRHRGFFSHRLTRPLHIQGYSDVYPQWGTHWWNFDLPPGWEEWVDRSLVEVCGFQWRKAHEAVLDFLACHKVESFSLRFEHLIADDATRRQTIEALVDWLGISLDGLEAVIEEGLPPVMSTEKPRPRRWLKKAELLQPVLQDPRIQQTVEQLGYEMDPTTWI